MSQRYLVSRPDGVKSKPVSRDSVLAMYHSGKLKDGWRITHDDGTNPLTVGEFIGEAEFLIESNRTNKTPKLKKARRKSTKQSQLVPMEVRQNADEKPPQFDLSNGVLDLKGPISPKEFIAFAGRLPDREVIVELEGERLQRKLPHSEVLKLAIANPDALWTCYESHHDQYVLRKAEKKNGWLRVAFGHF